MGTAILESALKEGKKRARMAGEPKKKKQHLVPRLILRKFSPDGRSISLVVLASGERIDGASLAQQCYQDYFYGSDGKVENAFSTTEGAFQSMLGDLSTEHLELSFARYLSLCGFSVELTQGREDLRAEARGHSFSVECKRPTNFDSVRENLKRIKAQLRKRKNILKPANGFAVIGIDRSHDLGGLGPVANLDALGRFIDRASQVVADNLTQLAYDVGLMSHAVFGAAVITIATRIEELQQPWTVEQVYVFRLSRKASDLAVVEDCMPLFNHQFGADASSVGR